jgi:hypothetical protein
MTMDFVHDDGGRKAAGFPPVHGLGGDCVCRAVAIASQVPYAEVHARLVHRTGRVRHSKRRPSPENGIHVTAPWFAAYMKELGFSRFVDCGFKHLSAITFPAKGRIVGQAIGHAFAIVDGVLHDTHVNPEYSVSGYWVKP